MPASAQEQFRDTLRRRHQALSAVRRAAAYDPPTSRIVSDALDAAQTFLCADRCAFAIREADEERFLLRAGRGWPERVVGCQSLGGEADALAGYTHVLGRPLVVEELTRFPQFRPEPVLLTSGTRSVLLAPVRGQRGASAILGLFNSTKRLFSPDDAELLLGLADVISAALYREDWRLRFAARRPPLRGPPGGTDSAPEARASGRMGPPSATHPADDDA